jgi:antagonist of KipI
MKAFEVIHPGIYTMIQDLGRPGFMKYGVPASGVSDTFAAKIGNRLVGNQPGAALLEILLFRLELLALDDLIIAVTGGDLSPTIHRTPLPMWQAVSIRKGDRLIFKGRKKGFRAFLAVRGGFEGPKFLGSRSVFARGLMGEPLKAGQILERENEILGPPSPRGLPPEMIPDYQTKEPIRVMLGPQEDRFTPQGVETFLSSQYKVSPQSDRMGYRLEGPKIEHVKGADIISESIARGAIQVPLDGNPIIMLWDAQVSGGYTKIATVISADLDRLAQVMPGDQLRFQPVSMEEAHRALREETERLQRAEKSILG